ncbi:MAG: mechanosensitive ion channel family protein [Candidatus Bathyarchaeota archaeon]|nr:mechanosensitive ion channel family protein [Candidatus Bathyarchaeota archaeon]
MLEDLTGIVMEEGYKYGLSLVSIIVIYFVYKSIMGIIKRKGTELGLEPHIRNILRLIVRVVAIVIASTVIMTIFDISSDLFVGASALIGAALGFGSSQTINNVVAGFYVLISQPFKVKDYVKIGDLEGQVEEIAINYTSLYTPTFNLLKVPNTSVTSSKILNLTHEGVIKYTFTMSFGHDYSEEDINKKVIQAAIKDFCDLYCNLDLRPPEAYLEGANRLEKIYLFRIFIPKGEAKILYTLQPELIECVMRNFDKLKAAQ